MKYTNLGKSPLMVSRLCFGTMSFGYANDAEESERLVKTALDLGVNFFDTAVAYTEGKSEEFLGKAVSGVRDQVVIATKFGCRQEIGEGINDRNSSRYHIRQAVESSLRRLRTDRIDVYIMHMPHAGMNLEETLLTLDDLVRQGKVLYIGCSNFPAWLLCKSLWISDSRRLHSFVVLQSVYNLIERGIEVEIMPLCKAEGVGIMAYRGLCRGVLAGRYFESGLPDADEKGERLARLYSDGTAFLRNFAEARGRTMAQAAVAWTLAQPAITCTVVGPTSVEEIEELARAVDWELGQDEVSDLRSAFPVPDTEHQIGVHAQWRTRFDLLLQ